jgi:DNA-binding IclR family transcriptional regulator
MKAQTPVTWDRVLSYLQAGHPQSFTNRHIANALNADMTDVSQLTRLLAKAGDICMYRDDGIYRCAMNLYRANGGSKQA